MTSADFLIYVKVQRDYIDMAKYFQGLKINRDPGESWILNEWLPQQAESFRKLWNLSKCQHCKCAINCGHNLKAECLNFNKRNSDDEQN